MDEDLQGIVERLNELLSSWIEQYSVLEQEDTRLLLAGSFDSCYYHNLELEFTGLLFCDCPEYMRAQSFRLVEGEEKARLAEHYGFAEDGLVLCITYSQREFFLAFRSLILREGTVFYYPRENLKPGERVASWVLNQG